MCLVLVAHRVHPRYPVVVAANRDEWRNRPSDRIFKWPDGVVAGRDRLAGGTWMAVRGGRFAATTNFREPGAERGNRSRGELPLRLVRAMLLEHELQAIQEMGPDFGGFHVIAGDGDALFHLSNRGEALSKLEPGLYGVSNGPLRQPWPKTRAGLAVLDRALQGEEPDIEAIFSMLGDRTIPPDHELPDTGWGIEWERKLAPIRIDAGPYGTRVSTVLLMGAQPRLIERSWDEGDGKEVQIYL